MAESQRLDPSERRRRALLASILIMFTIGGGVLNAAMEHEVWRSVDYVKVGSILVLAVILSLRATTAMRLTPRNPVLDDELARANRASAGSWGFWGLLATLLAVFVGNFYWPVSVQRIGPLVIVIGAAFAGMRFVYLERRGSRE